jgi:hypothetical protein
MGVFNVVGESMKELFDNPIFKALVPLLTLVLGFYGRRLFDWWKWRRKQFLHRIIVSLNSFHDGKLLLRTIFEKSLQEVFLNSYAVNVVERAASRTTDKDPLLDLPRDEAWHILNSALNAVAEEFHQGVVRRDMGLPVATERYTFCLTHERADDVKQEKVRLLMVKSDVLANLPKEMPALESPHHRLRFDTLHKMAAARSKRPELFLDVEICL